MNDIKLENGRINLEGLDGIADHLKALAVTNKTLDSIKTSLESADDKSSEWYRRATAAHKAWFWMRSRICERLSILRREEKELNRMRSKFESEELLEVLTKQHTKSDLRTFRMIAEAKAELRLQEVLNKATTQEAK